MISTSLTNTAQHALMQHVESIVGPIIAPHAQKMKMRWELFSHAEQIFQEESLRTATEQAAIEITLQRLGSVPQVREELQRSIPRFIQWTSALDRIFTQRPGETLFRLAFRIASLSFSILMGLYLPCLAVVSLFRGFSSLAIMLPFLTYQAFVFALTLAFVAILIGRLLSAKALPPGLSHLITATLSISIVICLSMTSLMAWSSRDLTDLWPTAAASFLSSAILFPIIARAYLAERKQARPWEQSLLS
jgi:hypothetical protein